MSPIRAMGYLPLLLLALPLTAQQNAPHSAIDTLIADAHYLRARTMTEAILRRAPNDVHALIQQSVVDWAFARLDASLAAAERAVSLAGDNPEAHTSLTNALGAKLLDPALGTFEKLSLAKRFKKTAEHTLQLDPNSLDALDDSGQFYWTAPSIVGGDKAKAQQFADRLTQIDPVRGAMLKTVFAQDERDRTKRAAQVEEIWKATVATRPNSYDAHVGLSSAYLDAGKSALAESEAKRAIALTPGRIAAYRQLATVYARGQRWGELEATLKQSHTAVPDDLSPDYEAASAILTANATTQMAHAEQYLRGYLARSAEGQAPTHAAAHWRLGLVLEQLGRKSEARQELENAVKQDGSLEGAKRDLKRLS